MAAHSAVHTLLPTSPSRSRWSRGRLAPRHGLSCVLFSGSPLLAKSWRVTDFQDDIIVDRDGSAGVTERITLAFVGQWQGIHRTIPIEYPGPNGTNYELFLKVTNVTDESGEQRKYGSSTADCS